MLLVFSGVLITHNYQLVMEMRMKMRVAACAIIYRKALRLSKSSLAETTIRQMVNMLSNDVSRFEFTEQHMHNVWLGPVECVFIMWLLYVYVGHKAFISFHSEFTSDINSFIIQFK